jgi:hypothetical protein
VLDADADRADLELRLIKLLLKDRARVHPFAGNGGSWRKAAVHSQNSIRPISRQMVFKPTIKGGIPGSAGVVKGGSAPRYFWQMHYMSCGSAAKFDPAFVKQSPPVGVFGSYPG